MLTIEAQLKKALHDALLKMGQEIDEEKIVIERSKEKAHGDYATNVALQSARLFRKAPAVIAKEISENLDKQYGFKIDKKKIDLKETIKTLGVHLVDVKLFEGVSGKIKVDVISL